MKHRRWIAIAVLIGGCYEVGDLTEDGGGGSGGSVVGPDGFSESGFPGGTTASGGMAGSGGVAGGGSGGSPDATTIQDAALDTMSTDAKDAADAKPDVTDASTPVGNWTSCKTLKYKGDCIGSSVMYFDDPAACNTDGVDYVCYVSRCSTIGASCLYDPTCGWDCDPKLSPTDVQHCGSELVGKCLDGVVAVKADNADSNNCYFKECQKLGATCQVKSGVADCY